MTLPSLVDIGLNLGHDSFDHDRDEVLRAAVDNGVRYMMITGASLAASRVAIELARNHLHHLRATAGVHPHHASELHEEQRDLLRTLMRTPEVVAAGECGLDYFRNFSPRSDQERAFRLQLELACEVQKPLFLHQRDAHDDFLSILRDYISRINGGVAHCFTGDVSQARAYLDLGLYIGITGWICDERRGVDLRQAVGYIPRDRLLIETDAPYLLPRDLVDKPGSRRNEPKYLPHILRAIVHCRNEDLTELAAATTENAQRLFGWPKTA